MVELHWEGSARSLRNRLICNQLYEISAIEDKLTDLLSRMWEPQDPAVPYKIFLLEPNEIVLVLHVKHDI